MKRAVFGAVLASLCASSLALDLQGTVRDFRMRGTTDGHPDFEWGIGGLQTGLVKPTLDGDGKPVFNGNPGDGFITDSTTFSQWFRDVPGVNQSWNHTLNMTDLSGGFYEYSNGDFFPADGLGFGNQGYAHNYAFTFELNTQFAYDQSKNLVFNFTGDDDVWVFINNKLAVDLGGVHGAASGSVDLNSQAAALGLADGNFYSLHLFFAERHTSGSSFRMQTNLELQAVPEPATYAAFGAGLLLLKRRRR